MTCNLAAVVLTLEEITDENREAVLALRVAPGTGAVVSSVRDSLAEADRVPARQAVVTGAIFASGRAGRTGRVRDGSAGMRKPQPPEIIARWFLWKLLIDELVSGSWLRRGGRPADRG